MEVMWKSVEDSGDINRSRTEFGSINDHIGTGGFSGKFDYGIFIFLISALFITVEISQFKARLRLPIVHRSTKGHLS